MKKSNGHQRSTNTKTTNKSQNTKKPEIIVLDDSDSSEDDFVKPVPIKINTKAKATPIKKLSQEVEAIEEFPSPKKKTAKQRTTAIPATTNAKARTKRKSDEMDTQLDQKPSKKQKVSKTDTLKTTKEPIQTKKRGAPSHAANNNRLIFEDLIKKKNNELQRKKEIETELWIEKYKSKSELDLPVNKQKIEQVKSWIRDSVEKLPFHIKNVQKILILTGPSGCCKTTLLHVLCNDLNIEIFEWIDPSLYLWKDQEGFLFFLFQSIFLPPSPSSSCSPLH